ncbi:serine/threonine-protein kinase [Streptomyces sp. XD-27]|uniref:serine/threonine-protein kinase n=1 Tax=Streptomyces sp. XD-27 TaxID=3062779 RepID=UPI0026F41AB2|nr:serine/threonine-protein kinase [Streptomyces sp. XD-27]WKX70710.1 serine/threonine-protein kinase [Streptomyces sp. XD-27]
MSGTNGDGPDERDNYVDGGIKPLAVSDPARIGPYLLLGRLGAGGMGRVFLARSDSGRTVAVKVVHEEHVSDEQFRARFRREIKAARRVGERHTAPVLDAGPDDEPPWVATGYVPGLSLDQVVRQYGPLPAASLHALADGLLKALKDIHGAGIVHRDLKPSNVMLTVDGTKVIDFGIARALETSVESLLTSTGMVVGSPGFMSPEQVLGQRAGVKSDVFTLGCVLTYAATARLPFGQAASNQHAVMFQIVEGEPDLTGVEDASLRALIARCLAKDVDQRPDVDALLEDPERVRPRTARGAWLPAGVVAHLARQSARLLDAEAAPLREEPVDLATVGLRPKDGPPEVVPAVQGVAATKREREPRRRRTLIVLPIVVVITVGGGTVALLQPFGVAAGTEHVPSHQAPARVPLLVAAPRRARPAVHLPREEREARAGTTTRAMTARRGRARRTRRMSRTSGRAAAVVPGRRVLTAAAVHPVTTPVPTAAGPALRARTAEIRPRTTEVHPTPEARPPARRRPP